jgi:uncharacterized membrane protein
MDGFNGREPANKPVRPGRRFRLRPPSPFVFMILSAALFLLGAASFNGHGAKQLAGFGVLGAVAAIALIAAFLY